MTDETKKEPTTAYMFATVRRELESRAREARGIAVFGERAQRSVEDLALLERRMGALERTIRDVLKMDAIATPASERDRRWVALESALTDAPPVFTLEEVEKVVHAYVRPEMVGEALSYIAALRSTGGGR